MIKSYQHLFFDLDHTIWDFETNSKASMYDVYVKNQLANIGIPDFEYFFERYNYHNNRLWGRFTKGYIKQEELKWKRMWLSLFDFQIANDILARKMSVDFLEILPTKKALFPHTLEILEYLQNKGYKMHLITNGFEAVQQIKLITSGLKPYFTAVITSESSNAVKPNKEIFEFAFKQANALPHNSIMIGDNVDADIRGGIKAGMDTVFVNHINAIPVVQPTYIIYHLKELEQIF